MEYIPLICQQCEHYYFRQMISQPYSYCGEIPCLSCSRFMTQIEDKFIPIKRYNPEIPSV